MPHSFAKLPHVLSIFWLGIMAGFFWTYSVNVGQATAQLSGADYATFQSLLNRNVRNNSFFVFFFGPPVWVALALLCAWRQRLARWWWCLAAAGLLYLLGIVFFTAQVNLPNNAYTESWNPQQLPSDWAATRETWRHANHWRTVASGASFLLACLALSLRPAASAKPGRI